MFTRINLGRMIKILEKRKVYSEIRGGAIVDVQFKRNLLENKFYNFAGICLGKSNKGLATSVKVRNVISLYPLEYNFKLYSPLIKIVERKKNKSNRAKLYYLRRKPAPMSKINFHYLGE